MKRVWIPGLCLLLLGVGALDSEAARKRVRKSKPGRAAAASARQPAARPRLPAESPGHALAQRLPAPEAPVPLASAAPPRRSSFLRKLGWLGYTTAAGTLLWTAGEVSSGSPLLKDPTHVLSLVAAAAAGLAFGSLGLSAPATSERPMASEDHPGRAVVFDADRQPCTSPQR
jgi:hypothetical protein